MGQPLTTTNTTLVWQRKHERKAPKVSPITTGRQRHPRESSRSPSNSRMVEKDHRNLTKKKVSTARQPVRSSALRLLTMCYPHPEAVAPQRGLGPPPPEASGSPAAPHLFRPSLSSWDSRSEPGRGHSGPGTLHSCTTILQGEHPAINTLPPRHSYPPAAT